MRSLYYFYKYVRYNLSTVIKSLVTLTLGLYLMSYCFSLYNQVNSYEKLYNGALENSLLISRDYGAPYRTAKEYADDVNFKGIGFISSMAVADARNTRIVLQCSNLSDNVAASLEIPLSAGDGFNPSNGRLEAIVSYELRKAYEIGSTYTFTSVGNIAGETEYDAVVVGHADKNNLLPGYCNAFQYMYSTDRDVVFAGGDLFNDEVLNEIRISAAIIFDTTDADYYNSLNLYDVYTRVSDTYADYMEYIERDIYTYAFLTAIVLSIVLFGVGASEILGFDAKRRAYAVRFLCGERPLRLLSLRLITCTIVLLVALGINLLLFFTAWDTSGLSMTLGNVFAAACVTAAIYFLALTPSFVLQLTSSTVDDLRGAV